MKTKPFIKRAFVALFLLAAALQPAMAQEDIPALVKKIQPAVVMIYTYNKSGEALGLGSGFFISDKGDVITNRHLLQGADRAGIKTFDGKEYNIKGIVAEDKDGDLLRISVDIPPSYVVHPLKVSVSVPAVGEKIVVIGNPFGLEQTVSDGIVSAVRDIPGFGNIVQITAPLSPGSSGSPVVTLKGEVVGVATFIVKEGQNLNFAVPAERVTGLIPGKGKTLTEWNSGRTEELAASAEGFYSRGLTYLWAEDYKNALSCFKQAAEKNPRYADAYFQIGFCNGNLGRHQEAVDAFKQAIRINPDYVLAYYNLGVTYGELGRYQEAVDACKQAIRINPDLAGAHYNLGLAYGKLGRNQEAVDAYKQAIRINPDLAVAHNNLGLTNILLGRHQEAIDEFKQAIRINPDYAEAHKNMGIAYDQLGRHQEAVDAYKQAIRINPDYALAHYNLGISYLLINDKGSALDQYKILMKIDKELANKLFNLIYK